MSTQDKANNELDDAFRKSLEEPNIPFDPLAWQAMEKKLDTHHFDKAAYWRSFFGLLALLLIAVSLDVWHQTSRENKPPLTVIEQPVQENNITKETKQDKEKSTEQIISKHSKPKALASEKASQLKGSATNPVPVPNSVAEEETEQVKQENLKKKNDRELNGRQDPPAAADRPRSAEGLNNFETDSKPVVEKGIEKARSHPLPLEKKPVVTLLKTEAVPRKKESKLKEFKKPSERNLALTETNQKKTQKSNTELTKSSQKRKSELSTELTEWSQKGKPKNQHSYSSKLNLSKSDTATNLPESQYLILGAASIRSFQLVPTQVSIIELPLIPLLEQNPASPAAKSTDAVPVLAKRRKTPVEHRLSLNLMLAPDLSTVGFKNFTTPGTNLGLALEYGFSKRISILAGALYSTKKYYAGGEEYTPPKGYWTYGQPDQVKGDCNVIDLPINLRYNALLTEQYKVYISAGMSSYLMQKEQYDYLYKGYPPTLWTAPTRNQHWLSVVNFSVGYELRLKGPVSFQIEPFVKIPLAGVGAGKVKLASTGAFFTLKYYLNK